MKIGPVDRGDRPRKPEDERQRQDAQSNPSLKDDAVEISDSARTLAEQTAAPHDNDAGATGRLEPSDETSEMDLRAERIERARRRVDSGQYDRPEVREEIARRITDDFLR